MAAHPDVEQVIGSIRLEGGELRPEVVELLEQVRRGELTDDEAVETIKAHHGTTVPAK